MILNVNQTTRHKTPANLSRPKQDMRADIDDNDGGKETPRSRTEAAPEHVDLNIPAQPMDIPSFLSQLKIYNGTFSDENFWRILIRPFVLIVSPVVSATHVKIWVVCVFIHSAMLSLRHGSSS